MSAGHSFWHWCRIPPEPPKNRHKKLLASSLICTILTVSIVTSLAPFFGGLIAGQGSVLASSIVLSVAKLGEGPKYIQNATYQPIIESNNSTVQNYDRWIQVLQANKSDGSAFDRGFGGGGTTAYSKEDSGNINVTVTNVGDQNLTITSIEIYRGGKLFALIDGPFIVGAHTVGAVNLQLYNLTGLSKTEVQQPTLTSEQEGCNVTVSYPWPYSWRPVLYTIVFNTPDGILWSNDHFTFPTAPDPSYLFDSEGQLLGWPLDGPVQG